MSEQKIRTLSRQEVISCIERKADCESVPVAMCCWWGDGLYERYGEKLSELGKKYPDDVYQSWYNAPGGAESTAENPSYRWGFKDDYSSYQAHSIGKDVELLRDWDDLNDFLADFPNADEAGNMDGVVADLPNANGRYKLGCFWRIFHEKMWEIRGMENLMMDYYDNMDGLKKIGRKLLDFHMRIADRYAELGFDGIFSSDDLGHQTSSMMSPAIFEELYLPLYKEFIEHVHSKGMHFWLHSCGNNSLLMDYLIDVGLDVFHPVQKGCMDEKETAKKYGDKITFLYGVDVQDLLPNASPAEIESEIESMKELFYRPGGLIFAAGNGILGDTPIENIEAMLQTVYKFRK